MKTRNSAFYREICILRILVKMGYIDKKGFAAHYRYSGKGL